MQIANLQLQIKAMHLPQDGSDVAGPGQPCNPLIAILQPPIDPTKSTAVLIGCQGSDLKGTLWPDVECYNPTPIDTGYAGGIFYIDHDFALIGPGQAHECSPIFVANGLMANCSTQIELSNGKVDFATSNNSWGFSGATLPLAELIEGALLHLRVGYSIDWAKKTRSMLSVAFNGGKAQPTAGAVQNLPLTATNWASDLTLQLQRAIKPPFDFSGALYDHVELSY
jgi:hypothetical protein